MNSILSIVSILLCMPLAAYETIIIVDGSRARMATLACLEDHVAPHTIGFNRRVDLQDLTTDASTKLAIREAATKAHALYFKRNPDRPNTHDANELELYLLQDQNRHQEEPEKLPVQIAISSSVQASRTYATTVSASLLAQTAALPAPAQGHFSSSSVRARLSSGRGGRGRGGRLSRSDRNAQHAQEEKARLEYEERKLQEEANFAAAELLAQSNMTADQERESDVQEAIKFLDAALNAHDDDGIVSYGPWFQPSAEETKFGASSAEEDYDEPEPGSDSEDRNADKKHTFGLNKLD